MCRARTTIAALVPLFIFLSNPLAPAQEKVTIPKSRLEELERKEAELEKLKGNPKPAPAENPQLQKAPQPEAAKTAKPPAESTPAAPPIRSLPALADGELVSATDLAAHYEEDITSANQRYLKRTFKVKGEIVEFHATPFLRHYKYVLKTANPVRRVVCDFRIPDQYKAVIKNEYGTQLMGLTPAEVRVPLAKLGDAVVVEGKCDGLSDLTVTLSRCKLVH